MGNLIAPYRHAMFLPNSIANLGAWYHGAFTGAAADAEIVSWVDLAGNSRDAANAAGGFRPVRKDNIVNGRTVARFDGVDNWLRSAGFTSVPVTTVFILAKLNGLPGAGLGNFFDGATALSHMVYADNSPANFRMYAGTTELSGAATDTTTWHTHVAQFNGASSKIWTDGGAGTGGNAGSGALAAITIGANGGQAGGFVNADIAEIVEYDRALTLGEINQVGAYLAASAAITWNTAT